MTRRFELIVGDLVMNYDENKIDDAALALLYLTLHGDDRAWKGIDWGS